MPESPTPLVSAIVTRIRGRLDEPGVDVGPWLDTDLLEYWNEGLRDLWQQMRERREGVFLVRRRSTDPPQTIFGRLYDPAALTLATGTDAYPLPWDCAEVVTLEPLLATDGMDAGVRLEPQRLTHPAMRAARRMPQSVSPLVYGWDVTLEASGPMLVVRPTPTLQAPVAVELCYIRQLRPLALTDSLEADRALTPAMVDAAVAYAEAEGRRTRNQPGVADALARWQAKAALAIRSLSPRQSTRLPVVTGALEADLDW